MRKRSQAPFEMLILLFLFWAVLLPLIRLLSLVGKVDVWMIVRNPQFINAAKKLYAGCHCRDYYIGSSGLWGCVVSCSNWDSL